MNSIASASTLTYNEYIYNITAYLNEEDGTITTIDPSSIKSLLIDYDYENNNMPILYMTLNISTPLMDIMIRSRNTSTIVLTVQKAVQNSNSSSIYTTYIEDRFTYFTIGDISNYDTSLKNSDDIKDRTDLYRTETIGLMSLNLVNSNKNTSPVNGIITGTMQSIVYYTLQHMKALLIEPFTYNEEEFGIIIPPLNSCAKIIEYLNSLKTFYDTGYVYFMDFDTTYLLSRSGEGTKKAGEKYSSILMRVVQEGNAATKIQGMAEDDTTGMYHLPYTMDEVKISDTHDIDKSFKKLYGVSSSGDSVSEELVNDTGLFTSKTENVRVINDNSRLVDNMRNDILDNATTVVANKTYLDGSILTPNKQYKLDASDGYQTTEYNGIYRLARKRELYARSDGSYFMSAALYLKKK